MSVRSLPMILESVTVDAGDFARRTGWEAKSEGLCKGDLCVPAPDVANPDGSLAVSVLAERLRMPLVTDEATGLMSLGPESGGNALSTVEVPDITLPDVDGNPFSLASLHGKKVLLVAWASW